jgi:hypothetical protein
MSMKGMNRSIQTCETRVFTIFWIAQSTIKQISQQRAD